MTTTPRVWKAEYQINPAETVDLLQTGVAIADIGLGRQVAVYNELGNVIGQIFDAEGRGHFAEVLQAEHGGGFDFLRKQPAGDDAA